MKIKKLDFIETLRQMKNLYDNGLYTYRDRRRMTKLSKHLCELIRLCAKHEADKVYAHCIDNYKQLVDTFIGWK